MTNEAWHEILANFEKAASATQEAASKGTSFAVAEGLVYVGTAIVTLASVIREGQNKTTEIERLARSAHDQAFPQGYGR